MPAGRVIIKSLCIGSESLGVIQYRQMCGRAGRAGLCKYGESFLLVKSSEKVRSLALSSQPIPNVTSQLHPQVDSGRGLLKAILELFSLNLCRCASDVIDQVKMTLFYAECTNEVAQRDAIKIAVRS